MLQIHPFQALRPSAGKAREFSCERLDHLSQESLANVATQGAAGLAAIAAGAFGAEYLEACRQGRTLIEEPESTTYMHRWAGGGHRAAGVVALLEARALGEGRIIPMRHTKAGADVRWRRLQERVSAQVDSVIVGFHRSDPLHDLFEREMNDRPLFHVVADDGGTHTFWRGRRSAELQDAFRHVERCYVLEGLEKLSAPAADGLVPALLLPLEDAVPRWSRRVLEGEPARTLAGWLQTHGQPVDTAVELPSGWLEACVAGPDLSPRRFRVPLPSPCAGDSRLEATESGRLERLLEGAMDSLAGVAARWIPGPVVPAADAKVEAWTVVVTLSRPSLAELVALADAGLLLPAGSTWFEPRFRSGFWLRRTTMLQ